MVTSFLVKPTPKTYVSRKRKKGIIPSKLREYINLDNIASELSDDELYKIGSQVVQGADQDEQSRYEWRETLESALKIVTQQKEGKSTPWPGASNVKYPLITESCIQYNARVMPEFIQGNRAVRVAVMIPDPDETAEDRADRLSRHMSYQVLNQIGNWRADSDRLFMTLPLFGTVYRKTYYDPIEKKPCVDFCLPFDIIINNDSPDLESASRVTHVIYLYANDLIERMRAGLYSDFSMDTLLGVDTDKELLVDDSVDNPHEVYEQHTWLDLDDDGYKEPYIVVVHKLSQKVLRIVARYDEDSFVFSKKGEFIKIKAHQYFTDYHFLPSPDGTFHSLGLGTILYPLNETINTILNQLLDAGTLANRQGGFIGKSLRVQKEDLRFRPGEWKQINAPTGQTISQNIYPLPIKEPSQTLMALLGSVTQAAKELANINDVLQGQIPAANTPATTVMAVVEQGMKVFSAMMERLFISFKKEYEKLYKLNEKYFDQYDTYDEAILTGMVSAADYKESGYGIFPVADPNQASDMHRLAQAQALMQLLQVPGINAPEVIDRYLKALRVQDIEKVFPPPQPQPPDPTVMMQLQMAEAQLENLKLQNADILMRREMEAIKISLEQERNEQQAILWSAQAAAQHTDSIATLAQTETLAGQQEIELASKQADAMNKAATLHGQLIENQAALGVQSQEQRIQAIEMALTQLLGLGQQPTQESGQQGQSATPQAAQAPNDQGDGSDGGSPPPQLSPDQQQQILEAQPSDSGAAEEQ
uniref:Putative co-chaperone GroES n=1 Tax=viral metagenome TaxID=1070528 RepID=A0A6M3KQI3_9ZZZZ